MFLAEGEDLLAAALAAGIEPVEVLAAADHEPSADVAALGARVALVQPELLAEVGTLAHPARVLALFRAADLPGPPSTVDLVLELHGVGDPGNVGTLLRSAEALGPAVVALGHGCADALGPKAVRAAMGATFRVPVVAASAAPALRSVALDARAETELAAVDLTGPTRFLLGAERDGLPAAVAATADVSARIPQAAGVDSLNVAMAGTIALYEARRQRRV